MKILESLSDAEVRTLAGSETPKPMPGTWVLTAPDGQTWTGDSPIQCVQAEMHARVPPQVALARIRRSLMEDAEAFNRLPGPGDDVPCVKCGAKALDTRLECTECGHDNYEAVTGRPFSAAPCDNYGSLHPEA